MIKKSSFNHIKWGSVSYAAWLACSPLLVQAEEPWPTAQLAPTGYTAAINSPTADVLPWHIGCEAIFITRGQHQQPEDRGLCALTQRHHCH